MKNMFLAATALCFGALLTSCKQEQSQEPGSVIDPLASPVYLAPDNNGIVLQDYFPDPSVVDSIGKSAGFEVVLSEDEQVLSLNPMDGMKPVENLRIYTAGGVVNDIPVFKSTAEEVSFKLDDQEKKYREVMLKGAFNGWVPERSVMEYQDGAWHYKAVFYPGNHQYLFVVDGQEMTDPDNPIKQSNGFGGFNSILEVGESGSKPMVNMEAIQENNLILSSDKSLEGALVYLDNQLLPADMVSVNGTKIGVKLPGRVTEGRSFIRIYPFDTKGSGNDLLIPLENGEVVTDAGVLNRNDMHTQVMYFLMVDRFRDGDTTNTKKVDNDTILPIANYYGGDLQGVVDKIDDGYFQSLGINTIWLSPITQNTEGAYGLWKDPYTRFSGYHGYWPVSNTKIDHRFGDEAVLKALIDKAHDQGMNVILDYVANHVHKEHPLYKEHPEWATDLYLPDGTMNTERWDDHRLTTWFDTHLPTLDFSQPEVVEKMTDSAAYWVTNFELDGFRHDATKHIQEEFWRTLTRKVRERTDRPIYQIGETYGSYDLIRSYINTGMLDAQFDFNLYDASVAAFAQPEAGFGGLARAVEQGMEYFGSHHLMGNITGNQDRARFISYASGDVRFDEDAKAAGWTRDIEISDSTAYKKLEMLHAFNLMIPGVPCIYYADEYGVPGGNDPDNRRQMKFEDLNEKEAALRNKVSELVKMRTGNMALLYGTTQVALPEEKVMAIKRSYLNDEVVAVFNKTQEPFSGEVFGTTVEVPAGDYTVIIKN
ncbi:alpha-amlyase [Robertkochia marina]|uniref:Alpha-amlyase n=1 Tax=Robertkochia marina TaxID=1227945 RepID=A0A4S3M3V5_9FLAO|nr:alpha-amylase family glycosyl hydrolase [Robertkochia marina]THD69773.1 alpha-amlyase [Robertkochia marina]TRZ46883.1 alpha-amlyase [Robertkochia marina]